MTDFTIHCPKCSARLSVPEDTEGKPARCPSCHEVFRVPSREDLLSDTVVCWLDLDKIDSTEEEDDLLTPVHPQAPVEQPKKKTSSVEKKPKPKPDTIDKPIRKNEKVIKAEDADKLKEEDDADHVSLDEIMRSADTSSTSHGSFLAIDINPIEPEQQLIMSKTSDPIIEKAGRHATDSGDKSKRKVNEDHSDTKHRHIFESKKLVVVAVGMFGVKFRFDSQLLRSMAFRSSMPFKCLNTSIESHDQLIARPLTWVDKTAADYTSSAELEQRYEMTIKARQTVKDVVENMTTIDEFPAPFNLPMPYFVSKEYASSVTVHCETFSTPDGLFCEVIIPSVAYALDWLGRVNGVIGEDYEHLAKEVLKYESKAWKSIPSNVRHRLNVWFDFQNGEHFLGYFNDGDFAKSDAGLGGLIVTDKRLVYCKYHNHGEIPLDVECEMLATINGIFADLKFKIDNVVKKSVRLRKQDVCILERIFQKLNSPIKMTVLAKQPSE